MKVKIRPHLLVRGKIELPSSKSFSIRAFMIAACGGRSIIINPSNCDDAKVALRTARALGSEVIKIKDNAWEVKPSGKKFNTKEIDVGESGTVLRFLLPLASLKGKDVIIDGKGTLKGRPNKYLCDSLRNIGVKIKGTGKNEGVPIIIKESVLKGGTIVIDGSLSSQFISALLITCPQLKENSTVKLKGKKLVSSDYITMTQQVLKSSGVSVSKRSAREYSIKGSQRFKGLKNFNVPSDHGLAAFLMAAAALVRSDVTLSGNLSDNLIQADGKIFTVLKKMGVRFIKTKKQVKIKGPFQLKGIDISLKDAPDLVPIVAILALFAKGKTRLFDIKHARAKESDRISDLRKELLKIGANVIEKQNEITIIPQKEYKQNCCLDPHNDHRLAMSFCVLGLKIGAAVKDIECINKSYPDFLADLKNLSIKYKKSKSI